jgi:hypothetical protein
VGEAYSVVQEQGALLLGRYLAGFLAQQSAQQRK